MKTLLRAAFCGGLVVLGCRFASAAPGPAPGADGPLVLRSHFIGTTDLFSDSAAARLKKIWSLPGSVALRNEAADRFARVAAQWLSGASGDAGTPLRPLIDDLLTFESHAEFQAAPEFVIAVRLPEPRAKAWDAALRKLAATAKFSNPAAASSDGIQGWQAQRSNAPQTLRVGRSGEWTVVASGPQKLGLPAAIAARLKQSSIKSGAWLEGDANLAHFGAFLPALSDFKSLPLAHFSFSNRADFVRTLIKFDFAKPHNWKAEPWNIPTNAIFDPLISFTAVRGIAPLLESMPFVREVGWSPTPNQISGWGLRGLPFQFMYATPARDITNQLRTAGPRLGTAIAKHGPANLAGRLVQAEGEISWQGLPLAVPRLASLRKDPNFLSFEMFPMAATKTPPPPELFQQLAHDNLVYYDWEITEDRLTSWRQMYQLAEIATGRRLTPTNAAGERFIIDAGKLLGESVTEASVTSPTEITVVRKSHLGLTSYELMTLTRWLESTNFPSFGVFPPQPKRALAPMAPGPQAPRR